MENNERWIISSIRYVSSENVNEMVLTHLHGILNVGFICSGENAGVVSMITIGNHVIRSVFKTEVDDRLTKIICVKKMLKDFKAKSVDELLIMLDMEGFALSSPYSVDLSKYAVSYEK